MYERPQSRRRAEQALFERLRTGDASARDALAKRFLPLARKLAWTFVGSDDRDDLEQVAAMALVKAIDRFDPGKGFAFSTFATPTIVGELKRHLRDRMWSVRVPREVQELALRVERVSRELGGELGRSPTVAEIAARTGSTTERVLEAVQAATARHAISFDQSRDSDDDPGAVARYVAVEELGYAAVEDAELLDRLMRVLPPRERRILDMRFREDRVQSQIAEAVGMSQMHVSRVIRDAIEQLWLAATEAPMATGQLSGPSRS